MGGKSSRSTGSNDSQSPLFLKIFFFANENDLENLTEADSPVFTAPDSRPDRRQAGGCDRAVLRPDSSRQNATDFRAPESFR